MSCVINLKIFNDEGEKTESRFVAKDETKTINEVIFERCQKLNISFPAVSLKMYRQQTGKPESKATILDANDLIEFAYEYFFHHPDFDNPSIIQASHFESTSTVVFPDLHDDSSPNSPSSNENADSTENVNNLRTVNSVAETLPSQKVFKNETYSQFLSELYYSNQEFMDKEFEEITRNETFDFYGDNILQRLSIPKNIACLVLLKKQQLMEYDVKINKIVRDVCQRTLVDAVAAVKQRTKLPNNATQPLLDFMFKLTQNDFFKIINKEDGPILEACRKRKQRKDKNNGFTSQKKSKLCFPATSIEDINQASHELSLAVTHKEVEDVIKRTCTLRCQWIQSMGNENRIRIPEEVIQQFPALLRDASLLKYDFHFMMENVFKLPVFNIKNALRSYSAAIISLSKDYKIIGSEDVIDENDLYESLKLLIQLVREYIKKTDLCEIQRIVAESEGSPSVEAMTKKRRDIGQTSPMIFIIDLFPNKKFYISTDDVALKINGDFGDALQPLVELHYIFNLQYAKEMVHVNMLLEHFSNMNLKKMPKARSNLFLDLKAKLQ